MSREDRAHDAALLRELRRTEGARFARRVWLQVQYERSKSRLYKRLMAKQKD